jgi:universal stress protein E
MKTPKRLLVVLGRNSSDHALLMKAGRLAWRFGAQLELFLCDAEHAYVLKHDYEPNHVAAASRDYIAQATDYLNGLRQVSALEGLEVSVSAACESPLYEGIVHRVVRSRADMVIKQAGGLHSATEATFDPNDWQLMRRCPVTLLMSRGRAWHAQPRFVAAVDVSAEETAGLAYNILNTSAMLSDAHGCETEVLYSQPLGLAEDVKGARSKALRKLLQQCHVDMRGMHILDGEPERTLPAALLEGRYDVLTMGALTHRPGVATMVGMLTSRLLEAADCDFVLVKPDGQPAMEMKGQAYASGDCRSE